MYNIALRGQACGKLLDLLENIFGYPETKASKDFEATLQPHSLLDPDEEPEAEAIRATGDTRPGSSETQEDLAMEGDNEKTKISYLHHWLDGKGIDKIKGWMNSKILISQEDYDALEERERIGQFSADKVESYFSLVENILTPRSNPLLAMEELHVAKQGSMTSQDFYSHVSFQTKRQRKEL